MGVDVGRDLVGELALHQLRDAAGELDDLHAADDLALGVVEDLAVLGGDQPGQLVGVPVDQLAEGEHHPRAAGERHVAPRLERVAGRPANGGVDVGGLGQEHLGLAARR